MMALARWPKDIWAAKPPVHVRLFDIVVIDIRRHCSDTMKLCRKYRYRTPESTQDSLGLMDLDAATSVARVRFSNLLASGTRDGKL